MSQCFKNCIFRDSYLKSATPEIHPTMINGWKRKVLDEASQIFETENQGKEIKENAETQINELYFKRS